MSILKKILAIGAEFYPCAQTKSVAGSVVGIATGYGRDGGGIESRWGDIFRNCLDRPWGPPSLPYNEYRVFPGRKSGQGVTLTPHPLLVPRSRKSRAIPLLSLCAVRPVQSLSTCTRVHFLQTRKWEVMKKKQLLLLILRKRPNAKSQ